MMSNGDYYPDTGMDYIQTGSDKDKIIKALVKQNEADKQRIKELEDTFSHYHVNAQNGTDACKECGLDLRDIIHIRVLRNK